MTDEGDEKGIWGTVVFTLAVFFIIMGIIGLFSPAHSQVSTSCANMADVANTIISINGEPEEKPKEWFDDFKQVFTELGFVAEFPNDVEKVMIVPNKSNNSVIIGFYINKCLIDQAMFMRLDAYEATVTVMERNRL